MKIIEGICDYYNQLFKDCINNFYADGSIPIEYEDGTVVHHKLYGAEWSVALQDLKINAVYADLSIQEENNWIIAMEHNDMSIIFKKIDGEYSILDKNNKKILLQASAELVSSFEKMIDFGFSWKPKKVSSNLLNLVRTNI